MLLATQVLDDRAMYVKFGLLSISLKIGGMVFITYTLHSLPYKNQLPPAAAEISHIYSWPRITTRIICQLVESSVLFIHKMYIFDAKQPRKKTLFCNIMLLVCRYLSGFCLIVRLAFSVQILKVNFRLWCKKFIGQLRKKMIAYFAMAFNLVVSCLVMGRKMAFYYKCHFDS